MSIRIRLFASLQEKWHFDQANLEAVDVQTVDDVWRRLTGEPIPPNVLVAVNMEYAHPETPVRDEDEVAFFPPVTGG